MFERYTEKARRVIFFARYEASQFGSPYIETEHLLLGLLREDRQLAKLVWRRGATEESIRARVEKKRSARGKISTAVDLPLSQEMKRVLAYAAEEAERLSDKHIGSEHLLLGLVREEKGLAAKILHESGLELVPLRLEIARLQAPAAAPEHLALPPLLAELSRDLSAAADRSELDPLVGRTAEFDRMIQILCRIENNNVALLGEPGVGKQAAVEGLAHRIAKGEVPSRLEDFRIIHIVLSPIVALLRESARVQDRLKDVVNGLTSPARTIFYVEGLFEEGVTGAIATAQLLRPLLSTGEIQCIAAGTRAEYQKAADKEPWLDDCFRVVELSAPSESEAIQILFAVKPRYESFHGVKYSDEALEQAVALSQRYLPDYCLPDKAIDLIDDAGAACALRQGALPEEVRAAQQRLKSTLLKMKNAIANHEFEEAKTYSDEEAADRQELQKLLEKHKVDLERTNVVGLNDIEEAVARRAGIAIERIRGKAGSETN